MAQCDSPEKKGGQEFVKRERAYSCLREKRREEKGREEKKREGDESNEGNKLGNPSLLSLDRALRFLQASSD